MFNSWLNCGDEFVGGVLGEWGFSLGVGVFLLLDEDEWGCSGREVYGL